MVDMRLTLTMDAIGTEIPNELFPDLGCVRVLEEFETPLLVQYRHRRSGEPFVYSWVDYDRHRDVNRWLVFRVASRSLASYMKGLSTFWELISSAPDGVLYVRDFAANGEVHRTALLNVDQLPANYRPDVDARHDEEDRPRATPDLTWTVLTAGHWALSDLGIVPNRYRKVYSGLYVFGPLDVERHEANLLWEESEELDIDVSEGRGAAATALYNWIEHKVPPERRAELERCALASPGELTLRVDPSVAEIVRRAIHGFAEASGWEMYSRLHLARHRDEDEIDDDEIDELCRTLCEITMMDWERVAVTFPYAKTRSDFVLAQARYTNGLAKYLRQKKIESY